MVPDGVASDRSRMARVVSSAGRRSAASHVACRHRSGCPAVTSITVVLERANDSADICTDDGHGMRAGRWAMAELEAGGGADEAGACACASTPVPAAASAHANNSPRAPEIRMECLLGAARGAGVRLYHRGTPAVGARSLEEAVSRAGAIRQARCDRP